MKNCVTSPPTSILPPIPIGQSHKSRAARTPATPAAALIKREEVKIQEFHLTPFSLLRRLKIRWYGPCMQARPRQGLGPELDRLARTRGNSCKAACDFTRWPRLPADLSA